MISEEPERQDEALQAAQEPVSAAQEPVSNDAPPPAEVPASVEVTPEAETSDETPAYASAAEAGPPAGEVDRPPQAAGPRPSFGGPRRRPDGDRERRPRGGFRRRKVCAFCVDKVGGIDYKDAGKLRRYLSDRARIDPRRKTGTCTKHQRWLGTALKRARQLALLPYTPEHMRGSGMQASRR